MSLIFEGLKHHAKHKEESPPLCEENALETDHLEANPPELLFQPYNPTWQNFFEPTNFGDDLKFSYAPPQLADENRENVMPMENENNSPKQDGSRGERLRMLRKNTIRKRINFSRTLKWHFEFSSIFEYSINYFLIAIESILSIPFKLFPLISRILFKSIHFCSRFSTSLVGDFFRKSIDFVDDCWATVKEKIGTGWGQFFSIIQNSFVSLCRIPKSIFEKILSICLPSAWIQGLTIFLLKGFAMVASCCLVIFVIHDMFYVTNSANRVAANTQLQRLELSEKASPKRKLKHFFRDPLVLQQGKIQHTLLSFHINTIQRYKNGAGNVVVDGKIFSIGALLNEHPKIRLEKIGKRSLYFSDKYGQQYKRSIENMLE